MAGITLEVAEAQLAKYLAAEEAVLLNQEYRFNSNGSERWVTRADLQWIQAGIKTWDDRIKGFSPRPGGGITVRRVGCIE